VTEIVLENEEGEATIPFTCTSPRCVDDMLGQIKNIYPDIEIVQPEGAS
jgi:hypothetical protein